MKKRKHQKKPPPEPVWNNRSRIRAAREYAIQVKETAVKWAEFRKKQDLLVRLNNELAMCSELDPFAVLKECADMIKYILNDGYHYTGGEEILRKAQAVIFKHEEGTKDGKTRQKRHN